jgi:hypothetical protein
MLSVPPDWREQVEERGLSERWVRLLGSCIASKAEKRPANAVILAEQLKAVQPTTQKYEPQAGRSANAVTLAEQIKDFQPASQEYEPQALYMRTYQEETLSRGHEEHPGSLPGSPRRCSNCSATKTVGNAFCKKCGRINWSVLGGFLVLWLVLAGPVLLAIGVAGRAKLEDWGVNGICAFLALIGNSSLLCLFVTLIMAIITKIRWSREQ